MKQIKNSKWISHCGI